jgi:glyoxylase-like metal-dependent hydrolase (beta-lactamase superfamily II)
MNFRLLLITVLLPLTALAARITDPHLPDTAPKRISTHVWEIEGFPNVGIVVGRSATLVVDTGLGPRNGAIVAKQAAKLRPGARLYLVTTHFHAEHTVGDGGFPADTVIVRSRVQQGELDRDGGAMAARFRSRAENVEFLPEGVTTRKPDVLFDQEHTLDLGGVHARILLVGPAHTLGDQVIWIPEDRTLLTGDLAMDNDPPLRYAAGASVAVWIAALDRLAELKPLHVVPDHGDVGDISLISKQREFLAK